MTTQLKTFMKSCCVDQSQWFEFKRQFFSKFPEKICHLGLGCSKFESCPPLGPVDYFLQFLGKIKLLSIAHPVNYSYLPPYWSCNYETASRLQSIKQQVNENTIRCIWVKYQRLGTYWGTPNHCQVGLSSQMCNKELVTFNKLTTTFCFFN